MGCGILTKVLNERVLCSDGKQPWVYTFKVKKEGKGHRIYARTDKKNASFQGYVETNTLKQLKLDFGVVSLEMKLKK